MRFLGSKYARNAFAARCGSFRRSPDPLAEFKGPTSKGRGGEEREGREGEEGKRRGGKGREEEGREGKGRGGRFDPPLGNDAVTMR